MNRDDIIRMAQEAGWEMPSTWDESDGFNSRLERFYALAYAAGAAAENEACAKRLEAVGCDHCAENIRARGQE